MDKENKEIEKTSDDNNLPETDMNEKEIENQQSIVNTKIPIYINIQKD